jgi:LysR family transcriptional regulator (chromosome initiation inhibitor)
MQILEESKIRPEAPASKAIYIFKHKLSAWLMDLSSKKSLQTLLGAKARAKNSLDKLIKTYEAKVQIDYEGLGVLSAVVREGSFDAAAKALHVTQSAVSQRVKALEEKVGGLLVVRGRPCVATDLGLQLARYAEQINVLEFELSERVRSMVGEVDAGQVTLRVAVNNDSLSTWFPAVIARARRELNVLFDVVPDDQEHTEASLISGDVLAIVSSSDKQITGCKRVALGAMDYIAVASKEVFQEHFSNGVTPASLNKTVCVAFDRKDSIQDQWMELALGEKVEIYSHFVPSYDGYVACCLNGAGWGLVPSFAAREHIESGALVEMSPGKTIKVSLYWQYGTLASEMMRQLVDIVLMEAQKQLVSR